MNVSIIGGSGYAGGELLRLLLDHPNVEIAQVSSVSSLGRFVHSAHPNLRGRTRLKFCLPDQIEPCDVLFVALHHGEVQGQIETLAQLAPRIIDLSSDFRLRDPTFYAQWYGHKHQAPAWLDHNNSPHCFVYGLPELHRDEIRQANYVSGVGCNATATILGLYPLFKSDLVDRDRGVLVEVKVGSSEGGRRENPGSHHPERSGAVRSFAPTGHRHTAEVIQELTLGGEMPTIHFTATAIEMVRGILATAHVFLKEPASEMDLWKTYRAAYQDEPFVRIVKEQRGIFRYPEPKILAGSNYCDVGFELDESSGRVVVMSAIDNLMKGAAGSAVQSMNLMCGFEETAGLTFSGLHPI